MICIAKIKGIHCVEFVDGGQGLVVDFIKEHIKYTGMQWSDGTLFPYISVEFLQLKREEVRKREWANFVAAEILPDRTFNPMPDSHTEKTLCLELGHWLVMESSGPVVMTAAEFNEKYTVV